MKKNTAISIGLALIMSAMLATAGMGESGSLKWHAFEEGVALGKSQGKKIFVYFWAEWCTYCHTMEKETFQNPNVVKALKKEFIAIKVNTDRERTLSEKFKIRGLPDNWFLAENGDIVGHRPGYIPAELFIKILESMAVGESDSR